MACISDGNSFPLCNLKNVDGQYVSRLISFGENFKTMTHTLKIVALLASVSTLFACNSGNTAGNSHTSSDTSKPMPHIAVTAVPNSPEFPNAQLSIKGVKGEKMGNDSAKVTFNFDVKNYELKSQTQMTGMDCANSAQGQHIHFILDNQPYKALYEPTNSITLATNSEHYLLAFLSRSYHESIKTKDAAVMYHFKVDEKGNIKKLDTPQTTMLFYSRPKGDYIGKDTANVLLDFYVWNGTLSQGGYSVNAHITNEDKPSQDTTITFADWKPVFLQNLGTGKAHVSLTLLDKNGQQAQGPNTAVTRNIKLAAQ
jgi:hypothetical protein